MYVNERQGLSTNSSMIANSYTIIDEPRRDATQHKHGNNGLKSKILSMSLKNLASVTKQIDTNQSISMPYPRNQRKVRNEVVSISSLNAKVIAIHNDLETKILLALTKYEDTIEYDYRSKKEARMHFQAFMSSIADRFEIIYGILSDTDTSVTSNNEYALILYVIYKENAWIADREARNALRKKRETLWKYFAGVADSFRGFASTALMLTESVTSTLAIKSVVVANLDSIGDTMVFHSNSFDDEEWPYESLVSYEVGNDFKEAAKLLDG